jgi:hypothetical protein
MAAACIEMVKNGSKSLVPQALPLRIRDTALAPVLFAIRCTALRALERRRHKIP